jgi:hypothetical protein
MIVFKLWFCLLVQLILNIAPIKSCSSGCRICSLNNAVASPLLYTEGRNDGAGSTLFSLIEAAAFAYHNGYNLGGTISCHHRVKHGLRIDKAVEFLLGTSELIHEGFLTSSSTIQDAPNEEWVEQQRTTLAKHHSFLIYNASTPAVAKVVPVDITPMPLVVEEKLNHWFDITFVTAMRQQVSCQIMDLLLKTVESSSATTTTTTTTTTTDQMSSNFNNNNNNDMRDVGYFGHHHHHHHHRLNVAMHVRRGDITERDNGRFDFDGTHNMRE